MALLDARKDSNAAKGGDTSASDSGDAAVLGFTAVDYPSQEPAQSNKDVPSSEDSIGSKPMGDNLGTSRSSYKEQPENPNAVTGS